MATLGARLAPPAAQTPSPNLEIPVPPELEAHEPPEARGIARDMVRLLVSHRDSNRVEHVRFTDLPDFLRAGDVVVVNVSATLPSALEARDQAGDHLGLHISTELPGKLWIVEPRNGKRPAFDRPTSLVLAAGANARLLVPYNRSDRLWIASIATDRPLLSFLREHGKPIAYPYVRGEWPIGMYQTVYARVPGSAEMPSAGRPFSRDVIERLYAKGIVVAELVLHTGVASPQRDEPPYEEWYCVPHDTAAKVNAAKRFGNRVIAIGTTVIRALESASDDHGIVSASNGWTDLVVAPPRHVRTADALITGFHEPKSTHIMMLEAFAGHQHIEASYREALSAGYLWHEFGDSHLIL